MERALSQIKLIKNNYLQLHDTLRDLLTLGIDPVPVPLNILNSDAAVDLRWKTNPVGQTKGPGSFITHTLVLSVVYPAVFFSAQRHHYKTLRKNILIMIGFRTG